MTPFDVTSDSYAKCNEDSKEKDAKFKVGDHVRILKYKRIFLYVIIMSRTGFTVNPHPIVA